MAKLFLDVDQGSAHWFKLRSGRPTASQFGRIMTPKQMKPATARYKYACTLIAERLLNWQSESLNTVQHVEDGKTNEPVAVKQFEFLYAKETQPCGFVMTDDERFGASPDRVSGVRGTSVAETLEIKCPTIPRHMEYLLFGHEDDYVCQIQGQLWVCEADKGHFYSYQTQMPGYYVETGRDENFIKCLTDCLERFSDELEAWTEKARQLGVFQAFPEVLSPLDAERGPPADEIDDIIAGRF